MTVKDPYDVDWTESSDLEVALSAHGGIKPAIVEAIRRGFMMEGEDPPDPLANWVEVGPGPAEGWTEIAPPSSRPAE